jgi:hypothetical protein
MDALFQIQALHRSRQRGRKRPISSASTTFIM